MKRHRLLILSLLVVALLVGGCSLSLWQAKRQYALNRQLIAALVLNDTNQAIALVNAGADPNTRYDPPPVPSLTLLLSQVFHHSPLPKNVSSTALGIACGEAWQHQTSIILEQERRSDNSQLVQSLLAHGAKIEDEDDGKNTALFYAANMGRPKTITLLLKFGANVNATNGWGATPLMWAAVKSSSVPVSLLLLHGARVNAQTGSGNTALHNVIETSLNEDIIRQLLAHGADPNQPNKYGVTPLQLAQKRHLPRLVALLKPIGK